MENEEEYISPTGVFSGNMLILTNPTEHLNQLEYTYRGYFVNQKGEKIKLSEPLMNEEGINSVMGLVKTIVNQMTIMSNLTKQDISALRDFLADTLAKDLMINGKDYGIRDDVVKSKIYFHALSTAHICMKRAFEGDDKRFWGKIQKEITNRVEGSVDKKDGIFSSLWRKN